MVSLGLPGAWTNSDEPADPFASCVGGAACLPAGAAALLTQQQLSCAVCKQLLSLLLQVHAPWPPSSSSPAGIPERSLLLFGCTSPGCGTASGSWRAFRYQSTSTNPSSGSASSGAGETGAQAEQRQHPQLQQLALDPVHVSFHPQGANRQSSACLQAGGAAGGLASRAPAGPAASSSGAPSRDGFGGDEAFGNSSSDWTVDDGGEAGSSMSFGDLDAALTNAVASRAASRSAAERSRREQQSQRDRQRSKGRQLPMPGPAEFATAAQSISTTIGSSHPGNITLSPPHGATEQMGGGRGSKGGAGAVGVAAGVPLPRFHLRWIEEPKKKPAAELREAEALHVARLVDRYQADHEMVDAEGETWAGERYERPALRGGDAAFPKFTKRLERSPQQCVRYCLHRGLLWPAAKAAAAADCPACGAPRLFELQAMPALHHALAEGLSWQQQQQQQQALDRGTTESEAASPAVPSIDSWSWLTVAVLTCSASCTRVLAGDGSGTCLAEEAVMLQNE